MAELFDRDNVVSCEVGWAVKLSDRLSECTSFQTLSNESTAAAALGHIHLGPGPLPVFADEFGSDELAHLFLVAQIFPQQEEGQQVIESASASADDPDESSVFHLAIRRFISPSELQVTQWGDVYKYLWDYSAKLSHELYSVANTYSATNTDLCPRIRSVTRVGLGFNTFSQQTTQGAAWQADYQIGVGDLLG